MDQLQRAYYQPRLRNALLELKGKAFEDWFAELAAFALGPDFVRVRPYGAAGDGKADARSLSDRTIYQCYAPETFRKDRVIAKIDEDFTGAITNWPNWIRRWVFVYNDCRGLPGTVHHHLDGLQSSNPSISIEIWGWVELIRLAERMELVGWESLFGIAPSRSGEEQVEPEDVADVSSGLGQVEPTPEGEPLTVPSVDKIKKNELSEDVQILLAAGKRKDHLVKRYFASHPRPNVGENIAEAFRERYLELKASGKSPDDIFLGLQRAIGERGSSRRQVAALAILSYLFDRCDIFEDPDAA